jgi:hypothetical protein
MERNLGAEIAITFSERLRHLYAPEDNDRLPPQMAACLERLRRAEQTTGSESDCHDGLSASSGRR